jgi:Uma2 family endonuclease
MAATTTQMTVEEFLRLPEVEGERLELIHGEVVCMGQAGYPHEITKANLNRVLTVWSIQNPPAMVFSESAYQLGRTDTLIPDLSLDSKRVVPGTTGLMQGAPELAIEVVSSESAARLEDKIELYFSRGSKSVWVVYPNNRTVRVFDVSGGAKLFAAHQPLVDPILPGFSVPTSAIFEGV